MKRIRNERGFTLIEIIAVLIILGILAAVAVPKYLDLAEDARTKAAQGAIAEMKARASLAYAKYLLLNTGAQPGDAGDFTINTDVGADFVIATELAGSNMKITVSQVQGVTLGAAVVGTWILPTQ